MELSIHKDPINLDDLCRDLKMHGLVFWHSTGPNFQKIARMVAAKGVTAIELCARPDGDVMNFLVMRHLVVDASAMVLLVEDAIKRWQAVDEPVPHIEPLICDEA